MATDDQVLSTIDLPSNEDVTAVALQEAEQLIDDDDDVIILEPVVEVLPLPAADISQVRTELGNMARNEGNLTVKLKKQPKITSFFKTSN